VTQAPPARAFRFGFKSRFGRTLIRLSHPLDMTPLRATFPPSSHWPSPPPPHSAMAVFAEFLPPPPPPPSFRFPLFSPKTWSPWPFFGWQTLVPQSECTSPTRWYIGLSQYCWPFLFQVFFPPFSFCTSTFFFPFTLPLINNPCRAMEYCFQGYSFLQRLLLSFEYGHGKTRLGFFPLLPSFQEGNYFPFRNRFLMSARFLSLSPDVNYPLLAHEVLFPP